MTNTVWLREAHLSPEPRSASLARTFVADELGRHDLHYLVHDVQLVVSELVTNSVQHARTPIDVVIAEHLFCVVLSVHDSSSAPLVVRTPDGSDPVGRGFMIVGGTSVEWGVDFPPQGGKSVWVIFGLRPPSFDDWAACL